ncbi:hypothetical protein Phum_PHUM457800 [Pediculus humanus corporis]|uniref:PCNA-associated factor histone-like domain-containing protein n=1 Tax=Pediculus humanus subsp. corporis TaxID=121224 RepID=E0VV20_PEDHC|nr:uncharacterized protein Phum_PHUM457800 [Pediculus humanus corporis]EEB17226.1 hypothetical protein Phum_PHUM457800 [Pediculus humanus corporis]
MVKTHSNPKNIRVTAKAPRKSTTTRPTDLSTSSGRKYTSLNNYVPRPVPAWQKEITTFFHRMEESDSSGPSTSENNLNTHQEDQESEESN